MRHAGASRYLSLSVLWIVALPACLVGPTMAKWKFHAGPEATKAAWAVGTKTEIRAAFSKACAAEYAAVGGFGGCIDSPESERAKITSAAVGDPTIFSVRNTGDAVLVEALRAGATTLEIKAKGRHGKVGSRSLHLAAATPTAVRAQYRSPPHDKFEPGCIGKRNPKRLWFPAGENFTLRYELYDGDLQVVGIPLVVTAQGPSGFREISAQPLLPTAFDVTYAMSEPGTFTVSTAAFPAFATVGAYTCQTLTGIGFTSVDESKGSFDLAHMVGDDVVCRGGQKCGITITADTPAVCDLGLKGGSVRSGVSGPGWVHRLSAGTCRISAVLDGTPHRATATFVFK